MKSNVLTLLLSLFLGVTYAQSFTLSGTIRDEAGYELSYVSIKDTVTKTGTFSDALGKYTMTIPSGNYVFEIKAFGYTTQNKKVNLVSDKVLDIQLFSEAILLDEIVIERNEVEESINSVEMSTEELSADEIKKIPAFLGEPDVLNAIKLFPGVTSVGEGATGFNVRGGNIDQNLILADNASIYSSSHLFGFFSVFNPDAVKDLKLYKGGMPAKYGERVSSVLTVTQRSGDMKKYSVDGGVGLVSSRLTVGGPIKKDKASFLLSGRRTYVDMFFKLAKNEGLRTTRTYFYDFNAKFDYSINSKNYITFTGYYGRDVFDLQNSTFRFDYGNTFGVINWDHKFNSDFSMNSSLSMTDYNYTLGGENFFYWTSRISTVTQKVNFEYTKIEGHNIQFGLQNNNHHFKPARVEPRGVLEQTFVDYQVPQEWAMENGLYVQDSYDVSKKVTIQAGLRYSLYQSFGKATEFVYESGKPKESSSVVDTINFRRNEVTATYMGLEPRFSTVYKIDSISSLKFAYNRNLQFLQLVSNTTSGLPLDVWKSADYHIEPLKVNQFAIGYVRGMFDNKIEATVETYFKTLRDVLDYKNNADLFLNPNLETELLAGKGRAYGLELMLRKKKGKFTGWLSYTLSRTELLVASEQKAETINNGQWYKASWHKPHDVSLVTSYEWSKRFSTSLNFVYATGRAITLPDGKYEILGVVIPNYSSRNQGRLSSYHRLDLSAELQSKKNGTRKWESYWVFSVYNVYARRNAYSYTFQSTEDFQPKVQRLAILGTFFPSVTYNFKF